MQYILLIYAAESVEPAYGTPEFDQLIADYGTFSQEASEAGVLLGGNALQPVATATSVSTKGGQTTITDGPFAETREMLGGYYLLDCKDLDEALAYAAKIPSAAHGTVEVRPVMTFD